MSELFVFLDLLTRSRDPVTAALVVARAARRLAGVAEIRVHEIRPGGNGDTVLCVARADARGDWHIGQEAEAYADGLPLVQAPEVARLRAGGGAYCPLGDGHRLLLPLSRDYVTRGALEVACPGPVPDASLELLTGLAILLENHLALLEYSQRDTLTRLLNRKTFDESLERIVAVTAPHPDPAPLRRGRREEQAPRHWLGVIDIDHFKAINDVHGHLFGDEVLLLIADLMRRSFRHYDLLFRFGGEEFVVILRPLGEVDAAGVFERFRRTVAEHVFPQLDRVTVSIGYARLEPEDTQVSVLEKADRALYFAKEHGRNRVAEYGGLVAAGLIVPAAAVSDIELF